MENGKHNRLDELLASYGADRSRWPAAERGAYPGHAGAAEDDAQGLDRILALASSAPPADEAMSRLLQRFGQNSTAEVIAFEPRPQAALRPKPKPFFRLAALPLAASLALGIYLGAQGDLDFAFPTSLTGAVALNEDAADDLGGVGEAIAYAEENLT